MTDLCGDKQKKKVHVVPKVGGPCPNSGKNGWATGPHSSTATDYNNVNHFVDIFESYTEGWYLV